MRRRTFLMLIAALFVTLLHEMERPVCAQVAQEARKFDEFGDILYSDLIARLDNLAIQLQSEPNTRGFLVVYRTRRDLPGLSNRFAQRMKSYLVKSRGIGKERVITVDGGVASCLVQELWIVPPGAAPKPRTDAYSRLFVDRDSARLVDEFPFDSGADQNEAGSFGDIEDRAGNLEALAEALLSEPRSRAHLIAYGQYYVERGAIDYANGRGGRAYTRTHVDVPNTAQKELRALKDVLVRVYHIAPSRISTVDGGFRKARKIELWIVPPGEAAPIATPNSFPSGKRRSPKPRAE